MYRYRYRYGGYARRKLSYFFCCIMRVGLCNLLLFWPAIGSRTPLACQSFHAPHSQGNDKKLCVHFEKAEKFPLPPGYNAPLTPAVRRSCCGALNHKLPVGKWGESALSVDLYTHKHTQIHWLPGPQTCSITSGGRQSGKTVRAKSANLSSTCGDAWLISLDAIHSNGHFNITSSASRLTTVPDNKAIHSPSGWWGRD